MAGRGGAAGALLCVLSAFVLAVSMNVQQYALSCDKESTMVRWFKGCCRCSRSKAAATQKEEVDDDKLLASARNKMWVCGLLLYLVAQLLFVASINMGEFALMSSLFTLVSAMHIGNYV